MAGALGLAAAGCASSGSGVASAARAPGVTDSRILLGTSSGMTGPAGSFAVALNAGTNAWFKHVNDVGGVNGRKIEYKVLDDGLDVSRAITNTRQLISDRVFAVVGGTGAGSVPAMAKLLDQSRVPYLYPPYSTPDFGDTAVHNVFAFLPTYGDQVTAITKWAMTTMGSGSVYHFGAQNPDQQAQIDGLRKVVEAGGGSWAGASIVAIGTPDITPYALKAASARPDYITFSTGPSESLKIINYLASVGKLPRKGFLALTSLPGRPLLDGVQNAQARKLIHSLIATVPETDPKAAECNAAVRKYYPSQAPDATTVFGCSIAQATVTALTKAGKDLTRARLIKALESMHDLDVSGVIPPVSYSTSSHMGMTTIPLVTIDGDHFIVKTNVPVTTG
jgi:branched-chain amino acid transport system substrate-binding protein